MLILHLRTCCWLLILLSYTMCNSTYALWSHKLCHYALRHACSSLTYIGSAQVVPDTKSRSALGETADGGLAEIFRREFGEPGSRRYEAARDNFIASEAGRAAAAGA